MLGRAGIALAGLALALGSLAASAPAASAGAARAAHAVPGGPMIRAHGTRPLSGRGVRNQEESTNWSGYAANGSTYTSVSANWTQPTGKCPGGDQYAAFWVGLDGYSSDTVEQTGSEVDCDGRTPEYYAWYEMYPAYPVNFSNPVEPGDSFSGSVTYNGGGKYTLVLTDHTQDWTQTVHASLSGAANSSAEAIVEAPCCTNSGNPLPLTDFGTANFSSVTVDGSPISNFDPAEIIMIDQQGRERDTISSSNDGDSFTAKWVRAN